MILGRNILTKLGIDLKFSTGIIEWDGTAAMMKDINASPESHAINESPAVQDASKCVKKILNAKYEPANINEVVKSCLHLDETKQNQLKELLNKYKKLFDGKLGHWKGKDYHVKLKPDAKP